MVKILKRAGEKKCYIEELQDEILGDIVSRLSTKEAAKACTVSRRWRKVSTLILSSCRNLDFDFTDKNYKKPNKHKKHSFTSAVEGTVTAMKKYGGLQLDNLRIAFHDHEGKLDSHLKLLGSYNWFQKYFLHWLKFANAKQVTSLDINIKARTLVHEPNTNSTSQHYSLESAVNPWVGFSSWDRLTTLSLKSVIMSDHDVDRFLSNSPNLETLLFKNVTFTTLVVKDTNPKLKRLEILHCAMFKNLHIVSAPNLESLKHVPVMNDYYQSFICDPYKKREYCPNLDKYLIKTDINLRILKAPKLEDICLGGPLCRKLILALQNFAHQLGELQLNMDLACGHEECWADSLPHWNLSFFPPFYDLLLGELDHLLSNFLPISYLFTEL